MKGIKSPLKGAEQVYIEFIRKFSKPIK